MKEQANTCSFFIGTHQLRYHLCEKILKNGPLNTPANFF